MIPSVVSSRICAANVLRTSTANLRSQTRSFASVLPSVPSTSKTALATTAQDNASEEAIGGPLRPHLNIAVNPNHGLYAFFRKLETEDGTTKYETVEEKDPRKDSSGRSWTAAELRRKSFKDLHTLWYVLLRERNLLATQKEETRRMSIDMLRTAHFPRVHRVRKSMARIKYVINERRLAYEGAVKIHEENRERLMQEKHERREEWEQRNAEKSVKAAKAAEKAEPGVGEESKAADLAAAGLFDTVGVSPGSSSNKQA